MSVLEVEGGRRLTGEIDIQGAKNSSLPILRQQQVEGKQPAAV